MYAITHMTKFYRPDCFPRTGKLIHTRVKLLYYQSYCMVVKLGSPTLREEERLRTFENKVLRKIFGAKRGEFTGEWRKLHNVELNGTHSLPNIIRNLKSRWLRWAGHVVHMELSRNAYRVLVERSEGKIPLGRPIRLLLLICVLGRVNISGHWRQ